MNKQTVESIVRNQDDELTIQHMNDDRAEIKQLKQKNDLLREQLASANIEIKDLKKKLRVAGRSNAHIMEYAEELEGRLYNECQRI